MASPADNDETGSRTGVSRRGLFSALPFVAAAGVGIAVLGDVSAASAADADPILMGVTNDLGADTTILTTSTINPAMEYRQTGTDLVTQVSAGLVQVIDGSGGLGGMAYRTENVAIDSNGSLEIAGDPTGMLRIDAVAVSTDVNNQSGYPGIVAESVGNRTIAATSSIGLNAGVEVPGVAVEALAKGHGTGVSTVSVSGQALKAGNADVATATDAALIETRGLGRALLAQSDNARSKQPAVTAASNGFGPGLQAIAANPSNPGPAVLGQGGTVGRGGRFSGGAAAITLVATAAKTHPTSGLLGDFVVDAAGRLWFCKGGAVWHQLA